MNNVSMYANKGLVGLKNLGNSCFLNSCIFILIHTYELGPILNGKINNDEYKQLLEAWKELSTTLFTTTQTSIAPVQFVNEVRKVALKKDMVDFSTTKQNDISEFLSFLINVFHESLAIRVKMTVCGKIKTDVDALGALCFNVIKNMYANEYSLILKLFYGVSFSTLRTPINMSRNAEPFFTLSLSIPKSIEKPTIFDCFDEYVKTEELDEDNWILDEKTGKKIPGEKQVRFWSLPQILIIELKRSLKREKNKTIVTFPIENADFSSYVDGYSSKNSVYNLYGVSNHFGNARSGHYTAHIKNANGSWYHCNDHLVSQISDPNEIITPNVNCIFYRRVS